jgi:hypothetical protein
LRWRYPWHLRRWPRDAARWGQEVAENLFAGHVNPLALRLPTVSGSKQVPTTLGISNRWFDAFRSSSDLRALESRNVSGRLYKSEAHLFMYQLDSLHVVKEALS